MALFKRNRNTEPAARRSDQKETPAPAAGNLYPAIEGGRLYETTARLADIQKSFLADCKEKGISAQDATTAIADAITAGAYPGAVSLKPRRNMSRDLYLLHGAVPEGAVVIAENDFDGLSLGIGRMPDGSDWPTEPDTDEPDAFYIERHHVVPSGEVPTYGNPDIDIPAAQKYKDINDRLSEMIDDRTA
jgi:hypothetical protein